MSRFAATEQRLDVTARKHPHFPREAALVLRLIKLLHKLSLDQSNEVLRPYGLSYAEYNVLMMIDASPDGTLNPSQLGDAAGEKSANITRLTTQLVDKGLIQRMPSAQDRRMLLLRLTEAGERLIEALIPDLCAQLDTYVRHLDPAALAQLQALLKTLLRGVEDAA
ncbi:MULTISPECIES: MarR family winged helix-turn-helix transcriptional regulator [Xanthomonas]|uniref:MarR family transcriptional regulator n=1 Tax=Xanthomonas rydalmerensis TaxID=3046274 RepID=A0ABZ0JSY0_9XANT|nr:MULTISPECIES: MarR family transcriptional regulator [unclassified Xanthomonas]MBB5943200.1 MarR family transcriptional repressor of emrRAB [Xanthomonas sp. 3307]MXV07325.1 MarR family transcriptional regulator [Xanthomonas sp. LMG 9002]WOS42418.1 MarR family transcriptional regulator [Xanthomonas sp. DM-2023]WOS46604.1 MarR family transcriptional regulator [Xanthomonas sp. DM-2023]WOS50784.1 MarR family transcriptional regulator [Xanthomonas sp. DM-2023]